MSVTTRSPDVPAALWAALSVLFISLFLQHEFNSRQAILFLIGVGLGVTLLHAMFGFTGAWRRIVRDRRGSGVRAQILLIAATSILFFPVLAKVFPEIHATGAVGQVGFSVLVGAFLFGIGMQLGGGCGSGTLFTVGGGQVVMLITLACFIIGATVGSLHLPWWLDLPNLGKVSIIESFGWAQALVLQLVLLAGLFMLVRWIELKRHGSVSPLTSEVARNSLTERLVIGPWPLWWAVISLAVLNFLTLMIAGHPWSITFAFGLWGVKLWAAIGGDPGTWVYWSTGYPAKALSSSVLADTTSIMNFGIIFGAVLASALAGSFAPESRIKRNRLIAAVAGGLLLGYGARLAFGCNIGALLSGIASGSLHGWLWLVAGFAGSMAGVYIRMLMKLDPALGGRK